MHMAASQLGVSTEGSFGQFTLVVLLLGLLRIEPNMLQAKCEQQAKEGRDEPLEKDLGELEPAATVSSGTMIRTRVTSMAVCVQ